MAPRTLPSMSGRSMFGQTVTVSLDVLRQYNGSENARPRKSVIFDGDANGGGIVPYHYRRSDFYNAVQWACGLELFLLIDRSMAGVLHDGSPERRAVHDLSRPARAVDEPRSARAMARGNAALGGRDDDARLDRPRILASTRSPP